MKKSLKITLVTFLVILGAILIVIIGCSVFAHSKNDKTQPTVEMSRWMNYIRDDAPLKSVAIPGAHDAGTAGISYLAETQDRDTAQLLACGTRYLDLRVAQAGKELKIYHGPFKGVTLQQVMNAVATFLQENPTEMLILDFQHFDGDAQQKALETVESTLGLYNEHDDAFQTVVLNNTDKTDVEFVDGLTLGECRGKCLILWGGDKANEFCAEKPYVFKRNNDNGTRENSVLHSYYEGALNKKSSSRYVEKALPHYIDLYKQQNSGLFVLQGQLTDGMFVFGPRFREAQHVGNMNKYVESLSSSNDLEIINIIIRDFVSPHKNALTINLNSAKGFVKSESTADFNKLIADNLKK